MSKIKMLISCLTFATTLLLICIPAKADNATADNMMPYLRTMYNVDGAKLILQNKQAILQECKKAHAPAEQIALAQAAVNDANNLLNTLNTMIARDMIIIQAAPAGVVNSPSLATNSLMAQGAWNDFVNREKAGHAMLYATGRVPTAAELNLATAPFTMTH